MATEVYADSLRHGDVVMVEMLENEFELVTVDGVNVSGPWALIYPSEGTPIHVYANEPVRVVSGPSLSL